MLIVDDDVGLLRRLRWAFSDYRVFPTRTRQEAVDLVRKETIPVAIVDLGPPDPDGAAEGLTALSEILAIAPATKVIVTTQNETREHALRAIVLGAYDFYQKPVDIDVLRFVVGRAEQMFELEAQNRWLAEAVPASPVEGIIASSPEMLRVLLNIEKISPIDVTVLLLGESGTGKELIGQAIHRMSRRARGPFIPINCAAIPESLLESELFGHEKGAFTDAVTQNIGKIESADHGTLFLDEIGDVPFGNASEVAALPARPDSRADWRAKPGASRRPHYLRDEPGSQSADGGEPLSRRPLLSLERGGGAGAAGARAAR